MLGGYDERFCGRYGGDDVDLNDRYARLGKLGIAKQEEVSREGFAYPDAALDECGAPVEIVIPRESLQLLD